MTKPRVTGKLAKSVEVTVISYPNAFVPETEEKSLKIDPEELPRVADVIEVNGKALECFGAEINERLESLFAHYGLPRTGNDAWDYKFLALRLAGELHPGLAEPRHPYLNPYEHKRSNPETLTLLLADVETVKRERAPRKCTDRQAIRKLLVEKRFEKQWGAIRRRSSESSDVRDPEKTLLNWLVDARDPAKNGYFTYWQACGLRGDLSRLIEDINRRVRGAPN